MKYNAKNIPQLENVILSITCANMVVAINYKV